jgi:hypothetical protein
MGRVNKTIEGVFVDIVGSSSTISSYDKFMGNGIKNPSKNLKMFETEYNKTITKEKTTFEKLAKMEEIIMQLRAKENISNIKIHLVREYLYARCSFYRSGLQSKDIRVIVDNVEFWNSDIKSLMSNKTFMDKAKEKLISAMEKEIAENITNFKLTYKK